jgi:hypothetical protein
MPLLGFSNGGNNKKKEKKRKRKICKIVAYGCQTPSAQRRSDQKISQVVTFFRGYQVGCPAFTKNARNTFYLW